jgi:hypothetical protein
MSIATLSRAALSSAGLALALALAAPAAARAQPPMVPAGSLAEAHHHIVTIHQQHAMDHLRVLHHHLRAHIEDGTPPDRETVAEHVRAAGEDLRRAQLHRQAAERAMDAPQRSANVDALEQLESSEGDAVRGQIAMESQVARPAPDHRALMTDAARTYHDIRRAYDAHTLLRHALRVHDASTPENGPTDRTARPQRRGTSRRAIR